MRAVRLTGPRQLEVVELPQPELVPGQVRIDVAACGICGSDLSCFKHGIFAGAVLGHEIAGVIEATEDPAWSVGARVIVDPKIPCMACIECARGASHRCVDALTRSIGQVHQGGFAEQLSVPASLLHAVPPTLDLPTAALAEPLAVALHGLRLAGARASDAAVVLGLGPLGLLAVAALRDLGARPIVGVDPVGVRRELALMLGADAAVTPGDAAARDAQPSLVVEASGHPSAIADAGNLASPGARILLLGIPMGEASVWPMTWVTRELTVIGSVAQEAADFVDALALLERVPAIGGVATSAVGLSGVPEAFERLIAAPDAGKVLVHPSSTGTAAD